MKTFSIMEEIDQEAGEIEELPEVEEGQDEPDWKALALKNQGIAKRLKTKLEKAQEKPEPKKEEPKAEPKPENQTILDYGQKAFLKTYGISGADELTLAKSWMERTGDQLDSMVEDEMFTAKLTKLRDAKAAKEALPVNPKRGVQTSPKDSPEYWLDKPFTEVPEELKRKVLNLKLIKEKEGDKFSGNKIVIQ
jgi:hypothetical protein